MKIISSANEVNYGSYDEGLDWNIQNYQIPARRKNFSVKKLSSLLKHCLRINIFTFRIQAEIEFLQTNGALRIMLIGYDMERDLYLDKTWLLVNRQFVWEGSPEKYQLFGKALGLNFDIYCESDGMLHFHFTYFNYYQLDFISSICRSAHQPLRNVNPYNLDHWSFSEKHAMLECSSVELLLDGNSYNVLYDSNTASAESNDAAQPGFNISYELFCGYLPEITRELRCQFWQNPYSTSNHQALSSNSAIEESEDSDLGVLLPVENVETNRQDLKFASRQLGQELAGALLIMGHDSCSSESAIWVEQGMRYRLPRITPSFGRSVGNSLACGALLPDLEWKLAAGKHLTLSFQPFSRSDNPKLVFPRTQTQRIYGLFHGKLLDQFGDALGIQKAIGFIDYREIQWRRKRKNLGYSKAL